MRKSAFTTILLGCIVIFAGAAAAIERHVPSEYPTIQAAINACNNGDTVIVAPGTYTGTGNRDIDFLGKAITVKSENGPESCIINCNGTYTNNHRGFYFDNGESRNSVLEGFTITNAYVVVMCEGGAGIYIYGASPTIKECIVINNSAELEQGSLCFCLGGGIYIGWESNPLITDCVISDNSVGDWGWGGGIYCDFSQMTLNNCLIYNNNALEYQGRGGGIYCEFSSVLIATNCTIAHNMANEEGGGIWLGAYQSPTRTITNSIIWGNSPDQIYTNDSTNVLVTYSDVQGGFSGTGNINYNPYFANSGSGDYHLKSEAGRWEPSSQSWVKDAVTSLCIDRGDPNSDWTAELWPHGRRVNMGAYGGTPQASMSLSDAGNIADLDNDKDVNFRDYALFADKWLNQRNLLPEDLDRDGTVEYDDLAVFAENWLYGIIPILTGADIIAELEYLEIINTYPDNMNIDPEDYPIILGVYSENGEVLIEMYFCSDVCPDAGGVMLVYKDILKEECVEIGGVAIFDPAWGAYLGCAPDVE
jgi:hypothetical protein